MCAAGACAFPNPQCPSGYVYDQSAGTLSGQCVPSATADLSVGDVIDMAMPSDVPDMAMPPDLTAPPDMVITCGMQGQPCTVGVGACARTGTVQCSAQNVASCSATPGAPDNTGTWHQAAATNGSWDWDCDGNIEYEYPSGDTTPPPLDSPIIASGNSCMDAASMPVCNAPHWFYQYEHSFGLPSCGHPVDNTVCSWGSNFCNNVTTQETPQGCH